MDDHKLNLAIHALMPVRYTVKKRGYYYRPGGAGYTDRIEEAWKLSLSLSEEAKKHEYPHDEPVTIHKELTPDYCSRWPDAWRAINHLILRDTDRVGLFEHFLGEATDSAGLALRRSFVGERLRLLSATPRQLCEAILDTTKAQHKEEETAP